MRVERAVKGAAAVAALVAVAALLALGAPWWARAQRAPAHSLPAFSGLNASGVTTSGPEAELDRGLRVYSEGATLRADIDARHGNLPPGEVEYSRPERYPWRLAAVIQIEFTAYLQKVGRDLKKDIGDLETLEPETQHYLKVTLSQELEARMRHIIMQQQLMTGNRYRLLAVDPMGSDPTGMRQMPPAFYTDGEGAKEILRRLGQTLSISLLAHERVLYDVVTAILMSGPSPVRQAIGHLLDPSHFPPAPDQDDIVTRLGKEGLPRMVVGVGGYTVGALGILAYSLTKQGLLGYDLDFNRITVTKYVLKTDKYGFGWRIDTAGFGFDNVHAGLQVGTEHATVAVLAGGKLQTGGGPVFPKPETTILATYKLVEGGAPGHVSSALALMAEAHIPWNSVDGKPRTEVGLLYHTVAPGSTPGSEKRWIVDSRVSGSVSDPDWRVQTTYKVQERRSNWYLGVGIGNERPIPQSSLDQYDSRRYGGPGAARQTYGYAFFGMDF
ncbi:MAG: hypothetical protein HYY25_07790 [Candidatus Wallbacteria bacterium]|nr:hypothetical protein [Candidatus Wallbacteria bacterium]